MLSAEELVRRGEMDLYEHGNILAAYDWFVKALRQNDPNALREIVVIGGRINCSFWEPLIEKVENMAGQGELSEEDKDEIVNLTFVSEDEENAGDVFQKLLGEVVKYDLLEQCIEDFRNALEECVDASDPKWMGL